MAEHGFFAKSKSTFFNRSLTMQPADAFKKPQQPYLDRSESVKKLSNPLGTMVTAGNSIKGKVKKLCSFFESGRTQLPAPEEPQLQSSYKSKLEKSPSNLGSSSTRLADAEKIIVVYFTSLRGIRRTYEDCYVVRMIFKGFRVYVDERDISMDSAYKKELQSLLSQKNVSLPHVFIGGKYLGGADVVKQLYETGELAKMLAGFPLRDPGYVCKACGDVRFVPCGNCSGSRKVYDEDDEVLKRCQACNENGLMRCLNCCS